MSGAPRSSALRRAARRGASAVLVVASLAASAGAAAPEPAHEPLSLPVRAERALRNGAPAAPAAADELLRIGWTGGNRHALELAFAAPGAELPDPPDPPERVEHARLLLHATADGAVSAPLALRIHGLLPSGDGPGARLRRTRASALWRLERGWRGPRGVAGSACVPFRRSSPDLAPVVNELLAAARAGGRVPVALRLSISIEDDAASEGSVDGEAAPPRPDRFVTAVPAAAWRGCPDPGAGGARLLLFPTLRSTLVGRELLGRVGDQSVSVHAVALVDLEWAVDHGATEALGMRTPPQRTAAGTPFEIALSGLRPDRRHHYRLRFRRPGRERFESGPLRSFHTRRPRGAPFRFAVQADPHLQNKLRSGDTGALARYRADLDAVLAEGPDFLFDLGDTFNSEFYAGRDAADAEEARARHLQQRAFFDRVAHSVPLFLVVGNHEGEQGWRLADGPDNLALRATRARQALFPNPGRDDSFRAPRESWPPGGAGAGGARESSYAFEWGDALFVALDPYAYTRRKPHRRGGTPGTLDRWDWTLGRAQYEWLRETLASSDARFKFVFTHQLTGGLNPYGRGGAAAASHARGGRGSFEWGGEAADGHYAFDEKRPGWGAPIHRLLREHGVRIVFRGHDHLYLRETLDGIVYQTVPQPAAMRGGAGHGENPELPLAAGPDAELHPNSGHLRVSVSPEAVTVEYVRSAPPGDPLQGHVQARYTIPAITP